MIINFWQNVLSIHQLPFLEELCINQNIKVNLIVCDINNNERKKMGWDAEISSPVNLKYIGDINILDYVTNSDANVFSGFINMLLIVSQLFSLNLEFISFRHLKMFLRNLVK